jgi:hypothetical protein
MRRGGERDGDSMAKKRKRSEDQVEHREGTESLEGLDIQTSSMRRISQITALDTDAKKKFQPSIEKVHTLNSHMQVVR